MKEMIDKSTIASEIEKKIKEIDEIGTYLSPKGVLTNLLCHLNTLEVQYVPESVYVVTRSEEHADYVEAAFLNEDNAEEYCKPFNKDEDSYVRNITKVKIQ
jgi:hypothetical protein